MPKRRGRREPREEKSKGHAKDPRLAHQLVVISVLSAHKSHTCEVYVHFTNLRMHVACSKRAYDPSSSSFHKLLLCSGLPERLWPRVYAWERSARDTPWMSIHRSNRKKTHQHKTCQPRLRQRNTQHTQDCSTNKARPRHPLRPPPSSQHLASPKLPSRSLPREPAREEETGCKRTVRLAPVNRQRRYFNNSPFIPAPRRKNGACASSAAVCAQSHWNGAGVPEYWHVHRSGLPNTSRIAPKSLETLDKQTAVSTRLTILKAKTRKQNKKTRTLRRSIQSTSSSGVSFNRFGFQQALRRRNQIKPNQIK